MTHPVALSECIIGYVDTVWQINITWLSCKLLNVKFMVYVQLPQLGNSSTPILICDKMFDSRLFNLILTVV